MRIGVISDTHIPDLSPLLPAGVKELFKGLDIILHVGDICELYVLEELQETYTLTFAISGDRDSQQVRRYLGEKRVVRFGERRVGMLHGHQLETQQRGPLSRIRRLLGWSPPPALLPDFLIGQFAEEKVHAVVFGHTHEPFVKVQDGVLLFNPGAAVPLPGQRPNVGILEVSERSITGRVLSL
jgi:putative phosphoesterase